MKEFKTEWVEVSKLKVGDILIEQGTQWRINYIKSLELLRIISCTWNKQGTKPKVPNMSRFAKKTEKKLRLAVDKPHDPCYDSDCECVFKNVPAFNCDCDCGSRFLCWDHYVDQYRQR